MGQEWFLPWQEMQGASEMAFDRPKLLESYQQERNAAGVRPEQVAGAASRFMCRKVSGCRPISRCLSNCTVRL